jgi:hypothetical protein
MNYFMPGLGLLVLGFGFFQFSNLFNLYDADAGVRDGPPVAFVVLRVCAFVSMAFGIVCILYSFL